MGHDESWLMVEDRVTEVTGDGCFDVEGKL
jgi:hypothetical protein